MALRFRRRSSGSGGNVMKLVGGVITLVMALFIGGKVLASIATSLGNFTETTNPFTSSLTFLGLTEGSATGAWATGAIVGVLGLAAIASFIMGYFKISFR